MSCYYLERDHRKRRRERQEWNPDLGVLATRLLFSLQDELFERLADGRL